MGSLGAVRLWRAPNGIGSQRPPLHPMAAAVVVAVVTPVVVAVVAPVVAAVVLLAVLLRIEALL